MRRDDPRRVAFDVLRAVDEADAYSNLELGRVLRERRLSGRDAAFATELVSGTLRMRGAYDVVLGSLVSRRLDPPVRDALRLGAHQLLGMRVPAHAAVGTTVSLVRAAVGHRPAGLVNAVLRKVSVRDFDSWMEHLDAPAVARFSHPGWVVDLLAEALGPRHEELPALLEADNRAPKVTLVARPGLAGREELGGEPLGISPYAVELPGGDPGGLPAVREGRAGVQDAGSQLVALLTTTAPVDGNDNRWLDMCAGPGGKSALLAALAAQRDARVVAGERQPHRAELVRSAVRATGRGMAGVVVADGTRPPWPPDRFDRVLVDAPCTGLGVLRRRPEARWRRSHDDLDDLVPLQRALLGAALDAVRPGGVVCYATCSPVVAETAEVVSAVLADRADLELLDAPGMVPWVEGAESTSQPGAVQLWPHLH
ncbi:MAG: RsmB/NOP family class I SAM-dependent RNA methyltransferase, partial [Marmoricola sp.]